MPMENISIMRLLRAAGLWSPEAPPSPESMEEVRVLLQLAADHPDQAVLEIMRGRRLAKEAKESAAQSVEAAGKLETILNGLLVGDPLLCHLEDLEIQEGRPLRAICRVGGDLRRLPIHPDVPVDELRDMKPWEYVCVNNANKEMVIVGTYRPARLSDRSQGEIVEFRGYVDRERGLVRVARMGRDEEIVSLSPHLYSEPLAPPGRLVLLRDDPRWVIGKVDCDLPQSRFEVSIRDFIHTKLDDIAGLDRVLEPLAKDIVLRMIRSDIRDSYDLRPLNGILLYSYQPGTGKTSLTRGLARWLYDLGQERDFDVALYVVKPNELKNKFHGEDARLVREDLCGSIRARQAAPRDRPLFILVVLDEIDSLGRRVGGDDDGPVLSAAQNDAVQALLAEMDGMIQASRGDGQPPSHVLWIGLTNRPDMVDHALKREGRFDLVVEVPALSREGAESVLAVYSRSSSLRWLLDDEVRTGLDEQTIRNRFLGPALDRVFDSVVLRYVPEAQRRVDVTAGQVLAGVHYMSGLNHAKDRAATRSLLGTGVDALTYEDVVVALAEQAFRVAQTLETDRKMLAKVLRLRSPVQRVELVEPDDVLDLELIRPRNH